VSSKTTAKKKPASKKASAKKAPIKNMASKKPAAKKVVAKDAAEKVESTKVNVVERGKVIDLNFIGSKDESAEARNVASRVRVRSQIDSDIEAFLSAGGKIASIEPNVMADPPRKPESNYGSRPI